ncbi:hypothetical protein TNCV_404771 [Trichonephila clavipes]|nr:hypothetical protein TNCV_404771 [Trichonephila clavipes]
MDCTSRYTCLCFSIHLIQKNRIKVISETCGLNCGILGQLYVHGWIENCNGTGFRDNKAHGIDLKTSLSITHSGMKAPWCARILDIELT